MIASLMMYDRPELSAALQRFWMLISQQLDQRGINHPERLSQDTDPLSVWRNPKMLLSQTCSMPYRLWLSEKTHLVGTLDYGLPNYRAGYYYSVVIVRKDRPEATFSALNPDATLAYNQEHSQSGYAAAFSHMHSCGLVLKNCRQTGAHRKSALAVLEDKADVAFIDAHTFRQIQQYDQWADGLRVLETTQPTPALPLISAQRELTDILFHCLVAAIKELRNEDRTALMIKGIVKLPKLVYMAME